MDIQQKDEESLAAYIPRFKGEAKRCNFTNNAVTIRIFVKGLKNSHTLAACVYEQGLQPKQIPSVMWRNFRQCSS